MNNLRHLAIIVDGNGRWAKERGLKRSEGHLEGSKNIDKLIKHIAANTEIKVLSLYVFSTENFNRPKEEVDFLMNLFHKWFKKLKKTINEYNIKVVFSGDDEPLDKSVIRERDELSLATKDNTGLIVNFCLNYGGRREIVNATKKIIESGVEADKVDEELFGKYLYQDLGDVDLLIRTSGEQRISNFLLWQISYAEFIFTDTYFPDLTAEKFDKLILEYQNRDRRFGKVKN